MYLNLEFHARRKWIAGVAPESRVRELFEKYPCFNSYEEVRHLVQILQYSAKVSIPSTPLHAWIAWARVFSFYKERLDKDL